MNPWVVRHVTWPLHQLKTNQHIGSWYQKLLKSQWWPEEQLQRWQEEQLRRLLIHAGRHVPYYKTRRTANGIHVETASEWAQWGRIPLLSKAVVREQFDRMQAEDQPRSFMTVQTSGSTGLPVAWRIDCRACDVHKAVRLRNYQWWDFRIGDRQVWLWGRDEFLGRRKALRDLVVQNKRVLGILDLSDETIEAFYQKLTKWKPAYLYAYPSGLMQLAQLCEQNGHDLSSLRWRGVISTAEMLTTTQRNYLKEVFGCAVMNEYGCSEAQVIAFECPRGNMHLNADTLKVEFLRDGRPVGAGELGEIVVTDFFNKAMPLIRYRTGDLGRSKPGSCPCGRTLPMMDLSVGRELEMVRFPDGRIVHPEVFTPPHENPLFHFIDRFRVIQEAPTRLRVQVVTPPQKLETVRQHFIELIASQLGDGFEVEVERVPEIPRDPSGKLRYFVSALPRESAFTEVS